MISCDTLLPPFLLLIYFRPTICGIFSLHFCFIIGPQRWSSLWQALKHHPLHKKPTVCGHWQLLWYQFETCARVMLFASEFSKVKPLPFFLNWITDISLLYHLIFFMRFTLSIFLWHTICHSKERPRGASETDWGHCIGLGGLYHCFLAWYVLPRLNWLMQSKAKGDGVCKETLYYKVLSTYKAVSKNLGMRHVAASARGVISCHDALSIIISSPPPATVLLHTISYISL